MHPRVCVMGMNAVSVDVTRQDKKGAECTLRSTVAIYKAAELFRVRERCSVVAREDKMCVLYKVM